MLTDREGPIAVLRTILCANPTPEQIVAALAANGLTIVSSQRPEMIEAIDDPRGYINEVLERRKITASRLCKLCEIAPSTLNRSLKPDYQFVISARILKKIKDWDQSQ